MLNSKYHRYTTELQNAVKFCLKIYNFLSLTGLMPVHSNLHGMPLSSPEISSRFIAFKHLKMDCNHIKAGQCVSTTASKAEGSFKINQCTEIYRQQEDYINTYYLLGYLDTITKEDLVQNQYLSFPYPAVTQEDIQIEKDYYNRKEQVAPFGITREITLESINHFLYKGSNTFRYASVQCLKAQYY